MNIVDAKIENADDIYKINNMCFGSEKLSIDSIKDYIGNVSHLDTVKIILDEDDILIGYIIYRINDDISELLDIAIDEKNRKKGLAKSLIAIMENDVRNKNSKKIMLEVRSDNKAAIELYIKSGYEKINTRKNYYKDPLMDAYVMEKKC